MRGSGRGALALGALLLGGCPQKTVERPYAPPTAEQLVEHLRARDGRIRSQRIEAKADYLEATANANNAVSESNKTNNSAKSPEFGSNKSCTPQ